MEKRKGIEEKEGDINGDNLQKIIFKETFLLDCDNNKQSYPHVTKGLIFMENSGD